MGFTAASICIVGLLFLVAVASASSEAPEECASPVTIEVACRGASNMHHGVEHDHCLRSLSLDPRSKEAGDIHGLTVLATRLAIDHAASIESKIDDLAELEEESSISLARFNHCLKQYGGTTDLLRDALDNLQAKIYGKALEQLTATLDASKNFEDTWKGERSLPIAEHYREYGRMPHIAEE